MQAIGSVIDARGRKAEREMDDGVGRTGASIVERRLVEDRADDPNSAAVPSRLIEEPVERSSKAVVV